MTEAHSELLGILLDFESAFGHSPTDALRKLQTALEVATRATFPNSNDIRQFVNGLQASIQPATRSNGIKLLQECSSSQCQFDICLWRTRCVTRTVDLFTSLGASYEAANLYFVWSRHFNQCQSCSGYKLAYIETGISVMANVGRYAEAEQLAQIVISALPEGQQLRLHALSGLRSTLSQAYRRDEADHINTQLLRELEMQGTPIPPGEILNQASFAIDSGNPTRALEWLAKLTDTDNKVNKSDLLFVRAHALSHLGFFMDAIPLYLVAAEEYMKAGAAPLAGECFQNTGAILEETGFHESAIPNHEKAIVLFRRSGKVHKLGSTLINYANSLKSVGRPSDAEHAAIEAIQAFEMQRDSRQVIAARLLQAGILLNVDSPDLVKVEALLHDINKTLPLNSDFEISTMLWHRRADLLMSQSKHTEAIIAIETARKLIQEHIATVKNIRARAYLMATRYLDFDRSYSQALILSGRSEAGMLAYEQGKAAANIFTDTSVIDLKKLYGTIGRLDPAAGALLFQNLSPKIYCWLLNSKGCSGGEVFPRSSLAESMRSFFQALESNLPTPHPVEVALSESLGTALNIVPGLAKSSYVFLIPDRFLAYLPWAAATKRDDKIFLEARPLLAGVYPTLPLLQAHLQPPVRHLPKIAVVVGNPEGTNPMLPGAEREALVVADFLSQAGWQVERLIGARVTKADVIYTLLNLSPSLFVLASHGSVNHLDNAKSGLWLGGNSTTDGTLTLEEILLHPEYFSSVKVFWLNTCEGGTPSMMMLDSQASLAASLLHCGVSTVVANLWSVSDASALALAILFFGEFVHGSCVAESVRVAQRALAMKEITSLENLNNWAERRGMDSRPFSQSILTIAGLRSRDSWDSRLLSSLDGWGSLVAFGNGMVKL